MKVFACFCFYENCLLILKIISVALFRGPTAYDFDPENAYRKPLCSVSWLLYMDSTGENRLIAAKQRQKRPMANMKGKDKILMRLSE
jgi:hypothetical protein